MQLVYHYLHNICMISSLFINFWTAHLFDKFFTFINVLSKLSTRFTFTINSGVYWVQPGGGDQSNNNRVCKRSETTSIAEKVDNMVVNWLVVRNKSFPFLFSIWLWSSRQSDMLRVFLGWGFYHTLRQET